MSLLGDLAKNALGKVLGGGQQPQAAGHGGISPAALSALLPMLPALLKSAGGLDGILAKFKSAGLGDKAAAWVSNGPNPPATADDVRAALGSHIDDVAQQTGQDPDEAASGLASILPGLIDKLTPHGTVPPAEEQHAGLSSLLSGGAGGLLGKLLGGA
jgi:uncharacterized protein YidB (DUF937 family)